MSNLHDVNDKSLSTGSYKDTIQCDMGYNDAKTGKYATLSEGKTAHKFTTRGEVCAYAAGFNAASRGE